MSTVTVPQALQAISNFGLLETVYQQRRPSYWGSVGAWLLCMAGMAVVGALGYYGEPLARSHGVEMVAVAATMLGSFGFILLGFLGPFLLSLYVIVNWLHVKPEFIAIYKDGLAKLANGKVTVLRWQEIQSIYENNVLLTGIFSSFARRCFLATTDGQTVDFNHFYDNYDQLLATVTERVYPHLSEEIAGQFGRGEEVCFGPVKVDHGGITIGSLTSAWNQISDYRLSNGSLVLFAKPFGSVSIPISAVPNFDLLAAVFKSQLNGLVNCTRL